MTGQILTEPALSKAEGLEMTSFMDFSASC